MVKNGKTLGTEQLAMGQVESIAQQLADERELELVEVELQKDARGKCVCIYLDKDGGLTLDDCEGYHRRIQPLLEDVPYDVLEVSSPGIDRPIKNLRDFEKKRGARVEVKLFAPFEGTKLFQGLLVAMDETSVTIELPGGSEKMFLRKSVAIIRPVIEVEIPDDENI